MLFLSCLLALSVGSCRSADDVAGLVDPPIIHTDSGALVSRLMPDDPLPYFRQSRMIWGINGHPLKQDTYTRLAGIEEQFDYLDSLQVTYYRVDVHVDTLRDDVTPAALTFGALLDIAERRHIRILPVLTNVPDRSNSSSDEANRRAGYRLGHVLASKYGGRVTHIEAGNELDLLSLREGRDGSNLTQYDSTILARTTAFLGGMAQGIRAGAPGTKIIINAAGWRHYAFFDALQQGSVDYDIIGYHWYSEMGDLDAVTPTGRSVLEHLAAYNKDIWITELNRRNGSLRETPPSDQAFWVAKYVRDLYKLERVTGVFIYELYDEQHLDRETEAHYGLVECSASPRSCLGTKTPKPAFDEYRYGIEEQVHGYEDYAYWAYTRLMGRAPDSSTSNRWTSRFTELANQSQRSKSPFIASIMHEHNPVFVGALYRRLLQRDPTDDEVSAWSERIGNGTSWRDIMSEICNSSEFWQLGGGTSAGFVGRLHSVLLRPSDPPSTSELLAQLASGWSRRQLIAAILDGREFHGLFIDEQYQALYGRLPAADERAYAIESMQHGLAQEGLIRELLRSREFWNAAIRAGYQRRLMRRVNSDVHDVQTALNHTRGPQ